MNSRAGPGSTLWCPRGWWSTRGLWWSRSPRSWLGGAGRSGSVGIVAAFGVQFHYYYSTYYSDYRSSHFWPRAASSQYQSSTYLPSRSRVHACLFRRRSSLFHIVVPLWFFSYCLGVLIKIIFEERFEEFKIRILVENGNRIKIWFDIFDFHKSSRNHINLTF